jgi:uncharacterized protein YndB with AHSA1/START domain
MNTDRIEKQIRLRASRARVWRALADPAEFGTWFGMKVEGEFAAGATVRAVIAPTKVDAEVAKAQQAFEGTPFDLTIVEVTPERRFAFRWLPFAVERGVDYSGEPSTLVEFEIEEADGGVLLKVTESGFDAISPQRRAKAFADNEAGWSMMVQVIDKYVGDER